MDLINIKSNGGLWVAVISDADFDALSLDVTTVGLGDPFLLANTGVVAATATHVRTLDVNNDGLLDVDLLFHSGDLVDGGAIQLETTELQLTGTTIDGQEIEGFNAVIVSNNKGRN